MQVTDSNPAKGAASQFIQGQRKKQRREAPESPWRALWGPHMPSQMPPSLRADTRSAMSTFQHSLLFLLVTELWDITNSCNVFNPIKVILFGGDLRFGEQFLDVTSKAQSIKEIQSREWTSLKLKMFALEDDVKRIKRQALV